MPDRILIAEDDPVQRSMLAALLQKKLHYDVVQAADGREALGYVRAANIGDLKAVLLDVMMPVMDGFEALSEIRKYRPDLPVLMLTGSDDTAVAVRAIKQGAMDFIVKPPVAEVLGVALTNALRMAALSQEVARLKRDREGALLFSDLIGYDAGLRDAVLLGQRAAASDVPVLLLGQTGVGKELFARALHGQSRRVGAAFVAINCGALPENLVESILFGHEKGAFTGATTRTIGKFREAEGGTIFLDEVAELPLDAQVKLLRVLQQKEVEPVGGTKPVKVNLRVISATHRDLQAEVRAGRFREDLWFRLNVLSIHLPPLCERREDIIPLAEHFVQRIAAADGVRPKLLTQEAKDELRAYGWPGNVRELENAVYRALVVAEGDEICPEDVRHTAMEKASPSFSLHYTTQSLDMLELQHTDGRSKSMAEIEAEVLRHALSRCGGNVAQAAEQLMVAKSTFYRKIKEAGLDS